MSEQNLTSSCSHEDVEAFKDLAEDLGREMECDSEYVPGIGFKDVVEAS